MLNRSRVNLSFSCSERFTCERPSQVVADHLQALNALFKRYSSGSTPQVHHVLSRPWVLEFPRYLAWIFSRIRASIASLEIRTFSATCFSTSLRPPAAGARVSGCRRNQWQKVPSSLSIFFLRNLWPIIHCKTWFLWPVCIPRSWQTTYWTYLPKYPGPPRISLLDKTIMPMCQSSSVYTSSTSLFSELQS